MLLRSWGDGDFDLRIALRECGKRGLDEGVHAARRASPVAVVEIELFALEDEGANAILGFISKLLHSIRGTLQRLKTYLRLCDGSQGRHRHVEAR